MLFQAFLQSPDGNIADLPPPVVSISHYTKYYFSNQAVSTIFSVQGGSGTIGSGQGTLTHQIIAGIDEAHDFVLYISIDRKANVQIKRFPVSQLTARPEALKLGIM